MRCWRRCTNEGLDFSLCRTFNLDEYVGLPPEHEGSYRYYMNRHLFSRVNVDPRNTHLPNGMARDLEAECRRYEEDIGGSAVSICSCWGWGRPGISGSTNRCPRCARGRG
jgi:glucosamine-6-phosphate deaminase